MASEKDLQKMVQIAKSFDYESKIDTTQTSFPVITYASPHAKAGDKKRQLEKATYMAMRCNIPQAMFSTHLINLCKTDDGADLENLRQKGFWKEKWNGLWILQAHGTDSGVSIDRITGAIKFYDQFGQYIIEEKAFRAGILKTCYTAARQKDAAIHNEKLVELVSFVEELRELQKLEPAGTLISAANLTTVVPLSHKEHWGLPVISPRHFIEDLSGATQELKKYFNGTLSELRQISKPKPKKKKPAAESKDDESIALQTLYDVATPAFFAKATLDLNKMMQDLQSVGPKDTQIETAAPENKDNNDQEEAKTENLKKANAVFSSNIVKIEDKYEQEFLRLCWFGTGGKIHPGISNDFCWKMRSGTLFSSMAEADDISRIYTKDY